MYPAGSNFENDMAANVANVSLMNTMYTTTFGNMSFMVQPAMKSQPGDGFPTVPYLSLEAIFYQQQASNPMVSPTNLFTGVSQGTQRMGNAQTIPDATGTERYSMGITAQP